MSAHAWAGALALLLCAANAAWGVLNSAPKARSGWPRPLWADRDHAALGQAAFLACAAAAALGFYNKVLLNCRPLGPASREEASFCFYVKDDISIGVLRYGLGVC